MGLEWIPSDAYMLRPFWKDFFENPTTVQLHHRTLAISSFISIFSLWTYSRVITTLPSVLLTGASAFMSVALIQVALGISTLLYLVPVPLAVAHQAGSLALLSIGTWLLHWMKRIPK
jgi:heme a synthase